MVAKRVVGTLLFILAFLALAAFTFILFAHAEGIDSVPGVDNLDAVAIVALVLFGIIALVLLLLLLIRKLDEREEEAEEAEAFFIPEADRAEKAEKQAAVVEEKLHTGRKQRPAVLTAPALGPIDAADLHFVPLGSQTWSGPQNNVFNFHFPRPAKRGLFSNDYVDIGGGRQVKIATLIAAPENLFANAHEEPITPPSSL